MPALPSLCASLGINSDFRTIDIDTSDQVHQIGGRVDEVLSTSLSIHSAHEEALRRIEHYSMTSMHSSAHSIRSMDSIRSELSRLEAMITTTKHPSESKTGHRHRRRDSTCTERRLSAVEGGNRDSDLPGPGPSPEHRGESSTTRDSGIGSAPRRTSFDGSERSLGCSSPSQRISQVAIEPCVPPDYHISSGASRSFLDGSDHINKRSVGRPAEGINESSFLYAEFSKKSGPPQHESPAIEIDCGAIHGILRQSLASMYPPEIVNYVSIRQVTALCEDHIKLLDKSPNVQMSAVGKMKEAGYVDQGAPASARSSMINLRSQLIELRNAIKVSRKQCIQAGYSLSELEKLFPPSGSGSYAPGDRQPPSPESDDSSSVYSEDFHSTNE